MFIDQLTMKNFGIVKDLTIDCKDRTVFIVGANGSGKSTVLEAISLCLTGKFDKDIPISDYVGPYNNDFEISLTTKDYKITRSCKSGKIVFNDGRTFNKITSVYPNLPFDPVLAYNLTYIKQGEMDIAFGDSKLVDKLLNMIFDFSRITNGYKAITSKLTQVMDTEKTKESVISSLSVPDINVADIEQKMMELTKSLQGSEIDKSYVSAQETLLKSFLDLKSKYEKFNVMKSELRTIDKPLMSMEDASIKFQNFQRMTNEVNKLTDLELEIKNIESIKDSFVIMSSLIDFSKIDRSLVNTEYTNEFLATCSNNRELIKRLLTTSEFVTQEQATELMNFIITNGKIDSDRIMFAKTEYTRCAENLKPIQRLITQYSLLSYSDSMEILTNHINTLLNDKSSEWKETKSNIEKLESHCLNEKEFKIIQEQNIEYSKYESMLSMLTKELNSVLAEGERIRSRIEVNSSQLEELKKQITDRSYAEILLKNYTDTLTAYSTSIASLNKIKKELEESFRVKTSLSEAKAVFAKLPTSIRKVILNPIEHIINSEFDKAFAFSNLGKVSIDWEHIDISIGNLKFAALSGAQKCGLAMMLRMAILKRLDSFIPIMLWDEPTNSMDGVRILQLKQFISRLSHSMQLFVCTHNMDIVDPTTGIVVSMS